MPKFKVGDIVRSGDNETALIYKILYVGHISYKVKTLHDGEEWVWPHSNCDNDLLDSVYRATRQFDKDLANLLEE
jgi:hypothetical protein